LNNISVIARKTKLLNFRGVPGLNSYTRSPVICSDFPSLTTLLGALTLAVIEHVLIFSINHIQGNGLKGNREWGRLEG
jgi:hypothetical protein